MIDFRLDTSDSILYLKPQSAFQQEDFAKLAQTVDPHIEAHGKLAGIIIEVTAFPGWESLGAMAAHFRFVRDHHKRIERIAVWTDVNFGGAQGHLGPACSA